MNERKEYDGARRSDEPNLVVAAEAIEAPGGREEVQLGNDKRETIINEDHLQDNDCCGGGGDGVVIWSVSLAESIKQDSSSLTCTTTSDVNSDDDAASIASRIDQIVAEQEEKLMTPSGEQASPAVSARDSMPTAEVSTKSNQLKRPGMNRVASANAISQHHDPSSEQRDYHAESREMDGRLSAGQLPHVVSKDTVRQRTKSVAETRLAQQMWRNELAAKSQPERGDLRSLESHRNSQQLSKANGSVVGDSHIDMTRPRSDTSSSMDRSALAALEGRQSSGDEQPLLNIQRSAWTLSDFDQAFNKLGDGTISASNSNSDLTSYETTLSGKTMADKLDSSNLLIKASKNAINQINGTLTPTFGTGGAMGKDRRLSCQIEGLNSEGERRLSHAHSIVSFASSIDSEGFNPMKRTKRPMQSGKLGKGGGDNDKQDGGRETADSCMRSCLNFTAIKQYVPILDWLPKYKRSYLWPDLMAGLTVTVLNISTSLSAAVVAQTELSVAFRSSIVNTFIYAILCSSRHTSFGSWSIMSQMLLISVRRALTDELILEQIDMGPTASWEPEEYERWHLNIIVMYTFLIGLVQLVCGLLNLGNLLASFIPEALCSSMIAATAFTMAIGQLANMCGTSNKILFAIERNTTVLLADLKYPPVSITDLFAGLFRWIQQILLLIKYSDQVNLACVVISVSTVILLFLNQFFIQRQLEKLFKRKILIPFEMIILVAMIIISYSLNLSNNFNVTTCGPIHIDFSMPNIPDLTLIRELWFESLATALISYTMVYIMAKNYSNKMNYDIDCNQELIACGAGNLIGGLFDALPATASFSRTAGQVEAGGQTQMASLINCLLLIVLAHLLGHHIAVLPVCVMAATLFFGFVRMMTRFSEILVYWRVCKVDFAIWVVTFVAIISTDLVNGFVYGFIFSILTMLYRAQNRRCYLLGSIENSDVYVPLVKYPAAREIDGVKIFQFCGPIHYVSADLFERLLRQKTRVDVKQITILQEEQKLTKSEPKDLGLPTHIVLDFSMISYIDSAGIHVIQKIIEDYKRINVIIFLASLASHVAAVVKSEPALWNTYKERFYVTLSDAVHCAVRDGRSRIAANLQSVCQ